MKEAFKMILSLSVSGTLTILGIFLFCRVFHRKFSRRWQYYIWLVAAVRLLVPFSGEINLMGHALTQAERYAVQTEALNAQRSPDPGRTSSENGGSTGDSGDKTDENVSVADSRGWESGRRAVEAVKRLTEHSGMVWLAVAVLLLVQKISAYRHFAGSVRAGSEPADLELLESFGQIMEEMRIRGTVELYTSHQVSSPLLAGWIRPMVILPVKEQSGMDLRYTLLHELTHYQRKDILYKWLIQLVICLHWFNPFVWFLGREVDRACELSCDEAVLEKLAADERRAYGDTLLHAADLKGIWKHSAGAVTLHENGRRLKERLTAIMEYRKETKRMKVRSLVLAVIIAGSAVSLGAYAGPGTAGKDDLRFSEGGDDFLLSDGTSVIERDGVFYILCDGVTEEKVPAAGVVDGTMILVVHRDLYTSVILSTSVTLSDDRSCLLEEAEEICQDMQKRETLSEEDAARILETAEELQKKDQQTLFYGSFEGSYYQSAYYQAPYLFFVGYDLTEEAAAQHAGKELLLAGGEKLRVCFADAEQKWMEDAGFLEALVGLFSEFRSRTGKRVSGIRRPIISSVEVVGYDVEGLTEGYYAKNDWGRFSVLLAELAADRQREYLEQAFQEKNMAVLSIVLNILYENDRLSDEQIDRYLTRAFENGEIDCFAVLTEYMSGELLQEWYAKLGGEAGGSSYSYILRDLLTDDGEESWEEEDWDEW